MTDRSWDGVHQRFDCLGIASIDVFSDEVPKEEVQGADDKWERNARQLDFQADTDGDRKDSSATPGSFGT